ncbi:EARP-interacting protein homolog isoform X1 [Echeneis naucrates]|uniref:EIPR1-like beta-propeller domain-containing protein n=1 Tax=Echeneis naucrates TaxID=173247 RepID=A0A665TXB3_ECHNA|nr:EARP and GARP complex-interacting protein 1 isoform X1 [Echeneis naucrates]
MEDDAPVIYGLEFQARALSAQTAETDAIRFLVGTQSLKFDNQIHIIDFDDENNIINKNVLLHQAGEIWHIGASPADKAVLTTCYNKSESHCFLLSLALFSASLCTIFLLIISCDSRVVSCAAVWRMPSDWETGSHESPDDTAHNPQTLELLCHLNDSAHGNAACVLWEPMGDGKRVISLADNHALLWDLQESSTQAVVSNTATLEGKGQLKFTSGKWSPHHNCSQLATANDTAIRGWDLRTMSQIYCIENAHGQLVRDLDFNPNRQYYLASCGDDCKVKFWDVRNIQEPVKSLEEHSHWVWSVRYNHSHDQLVLTASSDSRLILSNMVSISSEPFGHLVDDEELSEGEDNHQDDKGKEPLKDSVVSTYEEHEDSVYAAEWSSADPWLFASLSYDGRLVINRVPRALKYRILL